MRTSLPLFGLLLLAACRGASDDHASHASEIADDGTKVSEPVSPVRATGPSPYSQMRPALATSGSDFLAAWRECLRADTYECVIRAARIDALGKVLDDASIDLPHTAGTFDDEPAIAFDGTNYLVVWSHQHLKDGDPGPLQGARISKSGKVLDTSPIELGTKGGRPAIASTGSGWTVAWTELEAHEIHASLLGPDGAALVDDTMLVEVRPAPYARALSLASTGATFLLAWDNAPTTNAKGDVHAVRLDATNLGFLDPQPLDIAVDDQHNVNPEVASDGSRFLVSWTDLGGLGATARFVEADGTLGERTTLTTEGNYAQIGFDGTSYVLASTKGVARFDRKSLAFDISVEGPATTLFKPAPALAVTPTNTLVLQATPAYGDFPNAWDASGSTPLAGVLYDAELVPGATPVRPARSAAIANHVVSARNGDERLVVWHEYRRDWAHAEIRGALVKAGGALASEKSFLVRATDANGCTDPSVVFDGTDYIVAWNETAGDQPAGVGVVHVSAKGEVVGAPEIRGTARDPQLFANGKDVFVALSGGTVLRLDRGFISPDNHGLFTIDEPQMQTAVAFDGKDFVAAWLTPLAFEISVKTRRYGSDGTPRGETTSLATFDADPIVTVPRFNLAAASDGHGKTLIAWDDESSYIDGTVVDDSGARPVAHLSMPTSAGKRAQAPAIVNDGSEWLLAYAENDASRAKSGVFLQRLQVGSRVERISASKKLAAGLATKPSLSAGAESSALVTYALDGAVTVQAFSYTPGATPPPGSGDDDDDGTKPPTKKPDGTSEPSSDSDATTTPKAEDPAAPKSTVSVSAGCSSTSGGASSGFPMVLLAVAGVMAARRRRNAQ